MKYCLIGMNEQRLEAAKIMLLIIFGQRHAKVFIQGICK